MIVWAYALGSVIVVSLASLTGALTLSLGPKRLERIVFLLVALAVGAMLGGALLHLIPEAYEALGGGPRTGLLVLVGVVSFFVLEKFLHWQHQHGAPEALEGATGHHHHGGHSHGGSDPLATMSIIGSIAHHLIDGAVVAAAYTVSIETGIVTTLAVTAHEVPQQIGTFGVLVYAGMAPKRALLFNFAAGLSSVFGAIAVLLIGGDVSLWLVPITAGMFLYIAGSDLIPELNRSHSYPATKAVGQLVMILLGVALMAALLLFEGGGH